MYYFGSGILQSVSVFESQTGYVEAAWAEVLIL